MDVTFSTVGHLPTQDRKGMNEDSHWDRHYIPELLRKCFWAVLGWGGQTNVIHVSIILGMSNVIICTHLSFQMFSFPPLNAQSFTFLLKTIFSKYVEYSHVSHVTWLYYVSEA